MVRATVTSRWHLDNWIEQERVRVRTVLVQSTGWSEVCYLVYQVAV